MASRNTENIMDDLTCPLCHQIFKDPVVLLLCGHNFCRGCLQGQQKSGVMEGQEKTCPICQQICPADMCAPNIVLCKLVENRKVVGQMMTAPQDISDQLNCGLCHKIFRNPVVLRTCGHHFCHECLKKRSSDRGDTLCPTCQRKCPKDGYVHNMVLANLIKRMNLPISQDEEQRQEEGQGQEEEQEERREQEEVQARDLECEKHKERISLFCLNDQTLCCLVCRDSIQHVLHDFLPLAEASAIIKVNLSLNIMKQLELQDKVIDISKMQEEKITEHKAQKQQLSEYITNEFQKMHKFLNDAEREQRLKLDTIYDPILKEMEENRKKLIKDLKNLEKNLEECQKKMADGHIGILQDIRQFMQRQCETEQIEENLSVVNEKPQRGLFKGPYEYYAWRRMLSVVQPATSPLTLDPETAHRNLLVSEDLTSISYKSSFFRRVPDSPKRFSHFQVVLTREGFSDGHHYWEVGVDGKNQWTVGLARGTIDRKQTSHIFVLDDYWAVSYEFPYGLYLVTEPIELLGIKISLKRVGVYLDYEAGQVSFYDAEKMTHLYTYTATFSEKLYPYIGTASTEEAPVKIVHVQL